MALSKIQTADMLDAPNLGRRNLIINGAMQIWQRGTTSSALTHNSNVYHSVDRWSAVTDQNDGSGTLTTTFSQSTDVPSTETFPYSLKAVVTNTSFTPSGTDNTALFSHSIETYNANPLGWGTAGAKQATLSYWIKSSVAGTGTLQIRLHDSNNVSGASDGNFYTKFTINQANTWEKKTHLIPANTTDGWRRNVSATAMQLYWFFASEQGTVSTQDAWFRLNNYGQRHSDMTLDFQTTGGTAYLTGCQLEVGEQATPFEHRPYGEELALCERYFQVLADHDNSNVGQFMALAHTSSIARAFIQLRQTMRGSPTIDTNSSISNSWRWTGAGANNYNSTISFHSSSPTFFGVDNPDGTFSVGALHLFTNASGAYLYADAEL